MKYEKTLRKLSKQNKLTDKMIIEFFKKHESLDVVVVAKYIGQCNGFEITTDIGVAFLPDFPVTRYNKKQFRITGNQERIHDFSCPFPLNLGMGNVVNQQYEVSKLKGTSEYKKEIDSWVLSVFSPEIAITYFNKFILNSRALGQYKTIIFESIEAFYLGMDHIAIMSLLPVFEGGLRNIQVMMLNKNHDTVSAKNFEKGLRDILLLWGRKQLERYIWYPGCNGLTTVEIDFFTHMNPQCDVINSFRIFFRDTLYVPSKGSTQGFNRHLIVHLLQNDFNEPANFVRLFLALTHLTFIESLTNQTIPFMWPGVDEEDRKLAEYIKVVSKQFGDPRCKLLNQLGISEYDLAV
ncbi:hypothetical protein [Vibrio cyclitrophicus]|uniref:hypothetical protein n=1 Tax=Vibrio cyclitrophicus TaxID=47951 RepID=UPI0032E3A993